MKFIIFSLLVSTLFLFAGCSAPELRRPPQSEIDIFLEENPDLSPMDRECIHSGRFDIGISQRTLKFLLGEPKAIETVKKPWATQQHWIYRGGKIFVIEGENVVGIQEN